MSGMEKTPSNEKELPENYKEFSESGTTGNTQPNTKEISGNAKIGKTIFKQKCSMCHNIEKGGRNINGPNLYGFVGSEAGQAASGYDYSDANKNKNIIWNPETLSEFLEDPKKYMPGTKMLFKGIKQIQDRLDLIKYLVDECTAQQKDKDIYPPPYWQDK